MWIKNVVFERAVDEPALDADPGSEWLCEKLSPARKPDRPRTLSQ